MRCWVWCGRWAIFSLVVALFVAAPNALAQEGPEAMSAVPVNTAPPTISGEAEVGDVLTASPGSWTLNPSFQFQWESCGESVSGPPPYQREFSCAPITGATADTYTVARTDEGIRLRVTVTASSDGFAGAPADSAPTERVGAELIPAMTAVGALSPDRLPEQRQAPATLRIGFTSAANNAAVVPPLQSIAFDLSRDLSLHAAGLKSCSYNSVSSTAALARERCAAAQVGHGVVQAELAIKGRYEYSSVRGRLTAYYSAASGPSSARILARVQTQGPSPIVYVLPFRIEREKGRFATRLVVPKMPNIHGIILPGYTFPYGYQRISRINLVLGGSFTFDGERKSFVTASCPTRRGAVKVGFPLARADLAYSGSYAESDSDGDGDLRQTVLTRCRAY